ncbi:MAG: alpha/beta fold hydrolase [Nannocystaceae bacterium]
MKGDVGEGGDSDGELVVLRRDDGSPLRYRVWRAADPRATAVFFNGIMSHSHWFAPLVPALRAAGITMVGADRRGSGPNPEGRGDAASAAVLIGDAQAILAAESVPGRPLVVVGWCWGAILALHALHGAPVPIDALVLVTPGLLPSAEVRTRAAQGLQQAAGRRDDEPCVPTPIRETLFTEGPALDGFIRADALRLLAITPRFATLSGKLAALALARLPRLELPTLLVLAEHDGATDNAATLAAFERVGASYRSVVTLPTRHGVSFEAPQQLAAAIIAHIPAPGGAAPRTP